MSARDDVLKGLLSSPEARKRLAEAMIGPIMARRDYESVGRRAFLTLVPCGSCERTDYDEGYRSGCPECTVRSVTES